MKSYKYDLASFVVRNRNSKSVVNYKHLKHKSYH